MKTEELVKGKWYIHNPYNDLNRLWYIKYNSGNVVASEYINNSGIYYNSNGNFSSSIIEYLGEANLLEIAKYLPIGHPDLKQLSLIETLIL